MSIITHGSIKFAGITFPSGAIQKRLLEAVYTEAGVNPAQVAYVEAHGTGTKAGDPQELNSIADVFCTKDRQQPLLIGSTKSNMGHPEPASGLAALAKIIVAMEDGAIPANLHFKSPNTDIPALADGRLTVVAERTPWEGGFVGVNSFGFGGSNVHAILRSHGKQPHGAHPAAEQTRLFTFAGRTEEATLHGLKKMAESAQNVELQSLLQKTNDSAPHPYRGYALLNHDDQVQEVQVGTG